MKRREFVALVGGAAAWPLAVRAQQPAMPVVGYLSTGTPSSSAELVGAFRKSLEELGFLEHRNIAIEYRWVEGQYDRLPQLVADLIHRDVAVIAATGGARAAIAVKQSDTKIPVVFQIGGDPVALGLVASLNRPGGNMTGVVSQNVQLMPKRLELLHELLPAARTIGVLANPSNRTTEGELEEIRAAASRLALEIRVIQAASDGEFDQAFAALRQIHSDGLLIVADGLFNSRSEQLAKFALRDRLPAIYQFPEFAAAGGLMSYGGSDKDQYRQVGIYVGRILKGEKPDNLPVVQSTKVELVINLATAKALNIKFPISLLGRADEVIE
jgi:putative tryptophan/tyrosine transport system substrate-binding protein